MQELIHRLFHILVNGGIVLGIFVILLLNNKSVRKSRANAFLSVLLASLTFSIFHVQYAGEIIDHLAMHAYSLGDPTFLLIGPLLWFYVVELTGDRVTWSLANVLHFLPFLIVIFCSLTFQSLFGETALVGFLNAHPRLRFTLFWVLVVIQFSGYQVLVHRRWRNYQQVIKQEVSNTENVSISWVRFFMAVFLVVNLTFLFGLFAVIHLDIMRWVWGSAGLILSLSIFALGYKGILQREIFYFNSDLPVKPVEPKPAKDGAYDRALLDKLRVFMLDKKPFLDPELSLSGLAKQIGLSRNQLSQLINEGQGENFYDFVNKYRVEEVKRLMADPQKQNYNLLGMALEAGFKSKSTFNLIFKRFTGLTPTEYKKNIT